MADDDDQFHLGSGNWWDASRNSFDINGTTSPASIPISFGWPSDTAATASADARSMVFHGGDGGGVNPNLQMMGLGNFHHGSMAAAPSDQDHWRQKVYCGGASSEEYSSVHDFKKMNNRGFSLDQPQSFSSQASSNDSTITSQKTNTGFEVADSAAAYGLLLSENQQQQHSNFQNRSINYPYSSSGGCVGASSTLNKYPPFLRTSPPPPPAAHLHFTNNAPYWNASVPSAAITEHARSSFFPQALQTQIPKAPSFDEKPKNTTTKKNNTETSNKRPRNETPSSSPAFKVRKEKTGDRITALQQLVSPFGKTDTASVLSEAIECIKFLHGQLSVLSGPYMESGAPIQHQNQNSDKPKDQEDRREDLRSRGLCLVPISSTFPSTTSETTGDFWTPTFGGTFR